jgi:hypothetical protein
MHALPGFILACSIQHVFFVLIPGFYAGHQSLFSIGSWSFG